MPPQYKPHFLAVFYELYVLRLITYITKPFTSVSFCMSLVSGHLKI